mgnify:CR=1 FL=1
MVIQKPLVTVLMSVYNGEKYLRSCVESILNQTYKDFEFFIVNDQSTDDSVKIIESFHDRRIVIHHNEKNIGQTKSLNVGLRLSKGRYVARMDADDMAFPLWLEKTLSFMEINPENAAVGTAAVVMDGHGEMRKLLQTPNAFQQIVFNIFFGSAMNHVGALLNKKIIVEHGGYNEEFKIAQDFELWSSLIRGKKHIANISEALVAVRVHKSSKGFVEEQKRGLDEVSETICRNVDSMTNMKISYEDAMRLRMFYRFPEQLTNEDFEYTNNLYVKIFVNLRAEFSIEPLLIRNMLRKKLLIPYLKLAKSELINKRFMSAVKVITNYYETYRFRPASFVVFIMTFLGETIRNNNVSHYDGRWFENKIKEI